MSPLTARSSSRSIYIDHWNIAAKPFTWTATTDEILAKVRLAQTNIKKLVDNNPK
jgi:hypothetical protein